MADWSDAEVQKTLDLYIKMLEMDLLGREFNKSALNRELVSRLDGRTHKAVEFKLQNISYVLNEAGWPYVRGYRPASHIQLALIPAVAQFILDRPELDEFVRGALHHDDGKEFKASGQPLIAEPPTGQLLLRSWSPDRFGIQRDYLKMHESNTRLGLAGELAAVSFEKRRLRSNPQLAERVSHSAVEHGDGPGYDVRSFEEDGTDRFIEVKTTTYSEFTPFYFSANELEASRHYGDRYHLYRFFNFTTRTGLFRLSGALDDTTRMTAITFVAVPR